jgi:uncharacterized repeat protein (TIGR01451 family)
VTNFPFLNRAQALDFGGSYSAGDPCTPIVQVLAVSGTDDLGLTVSHTFTNPIVPLPGLLITRACPMATLVAGQVATFSGSVSNSGNVMLTNVIVFDAQAGGVLDKDTLLPGEVVSYSASYVLAQCGSNVTSRVSVFANEACAGTSVSNQTEIACSVICPLGVIFGSKVDGTNFVFSFATQTNVSYTVEFTDALPPTAWQAITNVPGDGSVSAFSDSITNTQRFYRLLISQ